MDWHHYLNIRYKHQLLLRVKMAQIAPLNDDIPWIKVHKLDPGYKHSLLLRIKSVNCSTKAVVPNWGMRLTRVPQGGAS